MVSLERHVMAQMKTEFLAMAKLCDLTLEQGPDCIDPQTFATHKESLEIQAGATLAYLDLATELNLVSKTYMELSRKDRVRRLKMTPVPALQPELQLF